MLWWIIEDDASLHRLLGKYLVAASDQVLVYDNGASAQAAMHSAVPNVPQAICVDLGLPGVSGWSLIRTLHSLPQFQHTAVIAMSARVDITDHASALEAGADAFVAKPFRAGDLLALGHRIAKEKQS